MKSPSAIAQSCSHRHGAGTRPIRECDRMPLSPTISKSHVPSRFAGSSRAHESRSPLSRPSSDISVSTPDGPSNHVSCALPVGSVSCDHITLSCPSPARRGVSTIPEGDTNKGVFFLPCEIKERDTYTQEEWGKIERLVAERGKSYKTSKGARGHLKSL